ncbi:ribonucleoprotein chloroplastic-like [Trifolium pratense]|uniref:Ribonucleoprotein chloroplastic-like n=1 Tax=Trifolium pratense TaxID=57577 RepID=A0A2K3PQ47_TRIPR|nr:ribonucleoprotein chloroplastic-like [Trifolium pratense]
MATLESAIITVLFTPQRFSNNYHFLPKSHDSVKFHSSSSSSSSLFSHKLHFSSSSSSSNSRTLCFALQEVTEAAIQDDKTEPLNNVKNKLCVFNLPWSQSAPDIKDLFAQCGTVISVELIIKSKEGKGKGYAFVTMDTGEEAQAVVDKFNGHEISGRIIRVEIAKRLKKPPPPPPPSGSPSSDARYVIYASNLAWKARSTHLKDIFTENFKEPVSARVVFQNADGRSAGYGFVSYHTKEEADAAVSALEGKELMGRPLRVKISEKKVKKAESEEGEEKIAAIEESEEQIAESGEGGEKQVVNAQLEES